MCFFQRITKKFLIYTVPELALIFARNRANSADFARYRPNSGEFAFAFRANSGVFARFPANSGDFVSFFLVTFLVLFRCFSLFFHFFYCLWRLLKEKDFSPFFAIFRFSILIFRAKNSENWRKFLFFLFYWVFNFF